MKTLIAAAFAAGALALTGCPDRQAEPERQQQGTGGAGDQQDQTDQAAPEDAEEVNPHVMGGSGEEGVVPPPGQTVGEGSRSEFEEPQLQDEPPAELEHPHEQP